ncbi:MAG: argininosuccinate synthase [Candidatus Marinimicrobia bacterium]|nr:argininosuccinate synthase [Candidatus Neomarinimicrobiota bacterium]MDP6455918.1 argininosuccinate synthase [Candidatus Neomarinimicrobiota bacterium]MDP6592982.1 argininosuccinate synthase [Candidatus Neomarinimicrobiota bacterium]MDP6835932.1 argininosuccinate synthase [Candidatus Neomarinimicrobiota bacterium]MDP6965983.1 argininosuccinate synthase [Candidatus Neomarinimicrobiota bacterium]
MSKKKVVLAYSGGLDTSVILKWLQNKGYAVICFVGNVGQREDFAAVEEKALKTGASKVFVEDLRREFITDFIFPALQGNALYEGRYLLGTSLARPVLAKRQIEIARSEGANFVAHGATGKGNDQVRFELTYYALNPDIQVISPWKDSEFLAEFKGRTDLLASAEAWEIPVSATKKHPYSEDENLMHISHEAGILEDPALRPAESVFSHTAGIDQTPGKETIIDIYFENGLPTKVVNLDDGTEQSDPLDLFLYLNGLAGEHGIGRLDMVENRFIGIKSRGIYETPGATVLWAAHRDLEGMAMDKEVMHLRDMLIPKFSELIYNGLWYSPEMDFIMSAFKKSQEAIDGKVTVALYKGNVTVVGRESHTSLYDQDFSSMEVEGGFDAEDSRGFINIHSIRLKAHNLVLHKRRPYNWRKE